MKNNDNELGVRLDKWLWAARFFKTRSLATQAIKGGKVRVDSNRVKSSKLANINQTISITKSQQYFEVIIIKLLDKRQSATIAQTLYKETQQSIEKRESLKQMKNLSNQIIHDSKGRPTKKDRRDIGKLKDLF